LENDESEKHRKVDAGPWRDSCLSARVVPERPCRGGGYGIDANRDFIALGLSDLISGLSHGFVVSGADSRTAAADAGGKTPLTSIFAAKAMAAVILFLTAPLAYLPTAALAAILISSALSLFDVASLRRYYTVSRPDGLGNSDEYEGKDVRREEGQKRSSLPRDVDTHFAWLRTRMSAERTLEAWMRTAVSLIGFGFTIVTFFEGLDRVEGITPPRNPNLPRYIGLLLSASGPRPWRSLSGSTS
jgi:hypothetical protein